MREIILSITMLAALSSVCSASSYDDGPTYEPKTARSSGGFLKTAIVGALMTLSPTPVQAQNPTFVGAYMGTMNSAPRSSSNDIWINKLGIAPYNSYYSGYASTSFGSDSSSIKPYGNFTMNYECVPDSHCKNVYIRAIKLCNKTFDVNYSADFVYNPAKLTLASWSSGNLYSTTAYYLDFALSVWNSTPALNTTAFEKTFSSVINNKTCPTSSSLSA